MGPVALLIFPSPPPHCHRGLARGMASLMSHVSGARGAGGDAGGEHGHDLATDAHPAAADLRPRLWCQIKGVRNARQRGATGNYVAVVQNLFQARGRTGTQSRAWRLEAASLRSHALSASAASARAAGGCAGAAAGGAAQRRRRDAAG